MLVHLRLVVPPQLADETRALLLAETYATNVTWADGQSIRPPGALVGVDVTRETADELIDRLIGLGLAGEGAISVTTPEATPFDEAERLDEAARGEPDDSVLWSVVIDQATAAAQGSWTFYAFLVLATVLAGVAVLTDSPILVVGAMVVGPDFGPVGAFCAGVVLRRWKLALRAARLLTVGYLWAVLLVAGLALLGRFAGVVTPAMVAADRPMTGFIWRPDLWSVIVAVVAGIVGSLALATEKSNTLVGVFIAVTTIPAAGNLAVASATGVTDEMVGSATQLVVNIIGMLVGGIATLWVERVAGDRFHLRPATKVGAWLRAAGRSWRAHRPPRRRAGR
ncbi:uncharacterized hydrophobic domain-containing protein [Austwickia chelonae]|uniref:DUF389 domain-containing protein n=1 Tax=Austwickia chelonae NBRC 105200 TaxID=1184607 RepID=K6VA76_9MICO|nr:DUF389 domain-containing protein [Austwickia chelonae]GAB79133.1 hypothetical protein AUCHE_20_00040 [Austwickia chelonae NBRC 105200]SEW42547.1 uncharacterized hydrophobic domain-containing protein [Austwickia chelonae]